MAQSAQEPGDDAVIALTAVIGAVPLLIGMAVFALVGRETRSRRLEEISQAEFSAAPAQP